MLSTALKFLSIALLGSRAAAQTIEPFVLDGRLDSATASDATYNSGGTISVNGYSITIPQNLQVQFPAAFAPFGDFAGAGAFVGHEVSADNMAQGGWKRGQWQGNRCIDSAAGTMKIKGGPTIRINDPNGTTRTLPLQHSAASRCVSQGLRLTRCVLRPIAQQDKAPCKPILGPVNTTFMLTTDSQAPDPLKMAPFQVGDYLEYSGINVGGTIVCYSIVAPNVQITTSGAPTYIRVEDAIIGIFDGTTTSEFGDSRFTQSMSTLALVKRQKEALALLHTREATFATSGNGELLQPQPPNTLENTSSAFLRVRRLPITRSTPAVMSNPCWISSSLKQTFLGNLWGQLNPWPGASAPATKSCAPFSPPASASSTATSGTASASIDPSASVSSTPSSSGSAAASTPTVAVGGTQTTRPGVVVKLGFNVTNQADFGANDLTYSWSQVSGPTVTLSSNTAASPSLTAPSSTATATYVFNIKVSSTSAGTSGSANVTIVSDPAVKDVVTIDSYTYNSSGGGQVTVTASTNIVGYNANLKLYLTNSATGTANAMTYLGNGKFSISLTKTKKPANGIFVASDGLGSKGATQLASVKLTDLLVFGHVIYTDQLALTLMVINIKGRTAVYQLDPTFTSFSLQH
ncbi:hypothetical protein KCU59_g74, partial [Aureobasidium melanogenum]